MENAIIQAVDAMNEAITVSMFEFARTCQALTQRGWQFLDIDYGEERLRVKPKMMIKREDEQKIIYNPNELDRLLSDECEKKSVERYRLPSA